MLRMRLGLAIVASAVLAAVCWVVAPAAAEAGNGKNKERKAHGRVVSLTIAADGSGSITIETHNHVVNGTAVAPPEVVTRTFQVGPSTVYEAVTASGMKPVTLAAIHKGEHVVVEGQNGVADKVGIVSHKHRKKAVAAVVN
jgi:hypothetical protein